MGSPDSTAPSRKKDRNYKRHGARYKARRRAVDILYEAEVRDIDPVAIVEDRLDLSRIDTMQVAPVANYSQQIVAGVAEEIDRIDEVIGNYLSADWELHRISAVDRAILRMAVWELIFNDEVPLKTALSEAVELAAQYSGAKAPAYINAVLDSAAKDIEELRSYSEPEELTGEEAESTVDGLSYEEALSAAEAELMAAEDELGSEGIEAELVGEIAAHSEDATISINSDIVVEETVSSMGTETAAENTEDIVPESPEETVVTTHSDGAVDEAGTGLPSAEADDTDSSNQLVVTKSVVPQIAEAGEPAQEQSVQSESSEKVDAGDSVQMESEHSAEAF